MVGTHIKIIQVVVPLHLHGISKVAKLGIVVGFDCLVSVFSLFIYFPLSPLLTNSVIIIHGVAQHGLQGLQHVYW